MSLKSINLISGFIFPVFFLVFACRLNADSGADIRNLNVSCLEINDLYKLILGNDIACRRYKTPEDAVAAANPGSGVLLLADGYPQRRLRLSDELYKIISDKKLRVYIEYPETIPGMDAGRVERAGIERGVITSRFFGSILDTMRIVTINDCHFIPVEADEAHITLARVAGFDRAVYGLPDVMHPVLFKHPDADVLVATTGLSHFITGRFGPGGSWKIIWGRILSWLSGGEGIWEIAFEPSVRPWFEAGDIIPRDARRSAVVRGTEWFLNAKLLIHPSWEAEADYITRLYPSRGTAPSPDAPVGDGKLGVMEGFASSIRFDGSQDMSWWVRDDCTGETAMAFALRALLDPDGISGRIASNLLDFIFIHSDLQGGPRGDVNGDSFGLLDWATTLGTGTYYGDDNARAVLGAVTASAALETGRWDEMILRAVLANFRTTGPEGFRGSRLREPELMKNGWIHYWKSSRVHYAPHFESWIWACYLWLYDKTGYEPLLAKTKTGIRMMMDAYPDKWEWTNGIAQERARMLLPLAWLIRLEDTPEHRQWLRRIAGDLLANQASCGALREELGKEGMGAYSSPRSNEEYGTNEATLLQENGDPVADMLYTSNFAFFGLNEAAHATNDAELENAARRLEDFLVRIQVRSAAHPALNGAWFRAFDFEKWEYWGSNADAGWGPWCTESGWTQGWIVSTLALRQLETSVWDLTAGSDIAKKFETYRGLMLPDGIIRN